MQAARLEEPASPTYKAPWGRGEGRSGVCAPPFSSQLEATNAIKASRASGDAALLVGLKILK